MDTTQLDLLFGWSAYLSAATTVATMVTAILFFTVGERFGRINDTVSVFQMLLMLPIATGLYLVTRPSGSGAALPLLAAGVGIIAMLITAVLQALLVFGAVKFEQTIAAVLTAGGAIGLWLALANGFAMSAGTLPIGLGVCGVGAGVGYVLGAVGFRLGGQQHPLSYIGAGLGLVGYSIWAVWLGRLFLES
jgi:hypothetical protein